MKLLSVIVPCYNEEENVPYFYQELMKQEAFFHEKVVSSSFETGKSLVFSKGFFFVVSIEKTIENEKTKWFSIVFNKTKKKWFE